MITSVNNGQVKNIIQLNQKTKARREQGLFVAEGRKMFGEAPRDWISKVYVSEALSGDAELMAQVEKLPHEIVTDSVFRQMSDTQTPQGIMTVLKKHHKKDKGCDGGTKGAPFLHERKKD